MSDQQRPTDGLADRRQTASVIVPEWLVLEAEAVGDPARSEPLIVFTLRGVQTSGVFIGLQELLSVTSVMIKRSRMCGKKSRTLPVMESALRRENVRI